jgi:hypothetical protein
VSIESSTKEFMTRTRGVHAWTVARAMNRLTPGIDWRKCSRIYMANEWAKMQDGNGLYGHEGLKHVTLDALCAAIEKEKRR